MNQEFTVYYIGTNLGRIYKIVQYYRNNEPFSKLLDIFEVAPNEAIQVMEISQTRKSLYVATDHRIKQIDLAMCNRRYDSCFRCVKDPYCGWDKDTNICRPYELGLLQVTMTTHIFCTLYTISYPHLIRDSMQLDSGSVLHLHPYSALLNIILATPHILI